MNTIISFRTEESQKNKLDEIATYQDRDRSYIINEAIDNYLTAYQEKIRRIENAEKQIEDGQVYDEKIWRKSFKR